MYHKERFATQQRTDDDGCCLCNLANLFILLHNFLNARLEIMEQKEVTRSVWTDCIKGYQMKTYNRELCRLVSIFHGG